MFIILRPYRLPKKYHILTGLLQNKRRAGARIWMTDCSYVCLVHCALECQRRRGKKTNEEACCQRMVKPAATKLLKIGKRARCIYCGATFHSMYLTQYKWNRAYICFCNSLLEMVSMLFYNSASGNAVQLHAVHLEMQCTVPKCIWKCICGAEVGEMQSQRGQPVSPDCCQLRTGFVRFC